MKYWERICKMQEEQTNKGIKKYGQTLEENTGMTISQRIQYAQEELIDGLMYLEHLKENNYSGISPNEYQLAALRTANTKAMDNPNEMITNAAMGLCGESGEIMDMIKKFKYQGHELNKVELAKELGDVLWYVALFARGLQLDLETVMRMNIDKLKARYPEGFEADKSLHREDE